MDMFSWPIPVATGIERLQIQAHIYRCQLSREELELTSEHSEPHTDGAAGEHRNQNGFDDLVFL
ncbi:hypothetical protein NECAME_05312 [Necator americanus]|uniref:Uncharacterized protein n=1 Tax=Necator americanus TaxID=51031 RepID=W2SI58_NECAM|nr:hypothetical protein NECAME_05312 [Necator americanus]ETN69329.1 hypothetical protein NECAME_05312 [Necator americanus]